MNIQAIAVIAAAILALLFVPHEILMPGAGVVLAVAIAGVLGMKAYMKRLDKAGKLDEPGRKQFLTEIAMTLAITGLVAFLILMFEFSD